MASNNITLTDSSSSPCSISEQESSDDSDIEGYGDAAHLQQIVPYRFEPERRVGAAEAPDHLADVVEPEQEPADRIANTDW